ncbi:MAG: RseC/MucC family positive regulator of sigma(E) [Bacteroidia bacterium]|nr:MAG: RseC/MucC family positive regulator of sigma(E) [Bacteroidia bacterium]
MIEHAGIIDRIEGDMAHVKIHSVSGCASCHAKGVCSAADQEEKYLDVVLKGAAYAPGEAVQVQVAKHLGFQAVALGYVYPFLLLMAVLIAFTAAGTPELRAGSYALLSIVPYYLVLFLLRKRIGSAFTFSIKKTN